MCLIRQLSIVSVALLATLCKVAFADETQPISYEVLEIEGLADDALNYQEPSKDKFTNGGIFKGFHLGGYSSAGITIPRKGNNEIAINEFSLILTWENDSRFRFFGELEFETPLTWNDEDQLNTKRSLVDLERLYVDYNFSEKINFRGGRFLTPTGRWNQLHASPLVWTSTRPLATSRLFPMSTNGVMALGAFPVAGKPFEYTVFIETLQDQIEDRDEIKFKDVKGARFAFGQSFNVGVNLLSFTERSIPNLNIANASYRLLGVDFISHYKNIEFLGEAFQRWDSSNKDGGSGAYLQTAVPLPYLNNWYGIARLEYLNRPAEKRTERWLIGATWLIKPAKLLKLEFTGGSGDQPESPRGFLASFAVLF